MSDSFTGKRVVLLGASSKGGIGEATARLLASRGACVLVSGRRSEPLVALAAEIGGESERCDIMDEAQIEALFAAANRKFGGVDIAINASGVSEGRPFAQMDLEHLMFMARLHFAGPALFIKHAAAMLPEGGAIVNFSSLTAYDRVPGYAAYAGSKLGGDSLIKTAAVEYAGKRLRINGIVPSLVPTPLSQAALEGRGAELLKRYTEAAITLTPLGRLATPDDIAQMVALVASDEWFETGQIITATGGNALLRLPKAGLSRS